MCLLQTEIDGLTGVVRFNEEGHRKNFTLQVMELTVDGEMIKVRKTPSLTYFPQHCEEITYFRHPSQRIIILQWPLKISELYCFLNNGKKINFLKPEEYDKSANHLISLI